MSSAPVIFEIVAASEDFRAAMQKVTETLAKIDVSGLQRLLDQIEGYDQHHPRPLPIDGHEYARRRRSR